MEHQRRHERKEKKHRQERDNVEQSRDEIHQNPRKEPRHPESQHHEISGAISQHRRELSLNDDDDYVRNWLDQTDLAETPTDIHRLSRAQHSCAALASNVNHIQLPLDTGKPERTMKTKRKFNPSSDSSLLDELRITHRKTKAQETENPETSRGAFPPTKRHKVALPASEISDISTESHVHNEIFEKRPRHKTREDRYDSKKKEKEKEAKKSEGKEPRKIRKERKGDRSKAARKAGEDLMQNFASKSIAQERLTIRPSSGLGLFRNGRASSPAKRRGVPDLAFSEMDFLQHSRLALAEKENNIRSKSREKEKRKVSRKHDEITTFFRPVRDFLEELHTNRQPRDYIRRSSSKERMPIFVPYREEAPPASHRASTLISEHPSLEVERTRPRSGLVPQTRPMSPKRRHSRNVRSDKESYISWSETVDSPSEVSRLVDQHRNSPTPESIRRSIERTGIFRDTGIMRRQSSGLSVEFSSPRLREYPNSVSDTHGQERSYQARDRRHSARKVVTEERPTSSSQSSSSSYQNRLTRLKEDDQPKKCTGASRSELEQKASRQEHRNSGSYEESQNKPVVKHFVSGTKLQGRPNSAPNAELSKSPIPVTTINREELAKKARIRRPATTQPIIRESIPNHEQTLSPATQPQLLEKVSSRGFSLDQLDQTTAIRDMPGNEAELGQIQFPQSTPHQDQRAFEYASGARDALLQPRSIEDHQVYLWTMPNFGTSSERIAKIDPCHEPQQPQEEVPYFNLPASSYGLSALSNSFTQTRLNSIPEEQPLSSQQLQPLAGLDPSSLREFDKPIDISRWHGETDMASVHETYSAEDQSYDADIPADYGNHEMERYLSDFDEEFGTPDLMLKNLPIDDMVDYEMLDGERQASGEYQELVNYEETGPLNDFNSQGNNLQYQQDYEQNASYSENMWGNRFMTDRF